MPNTDYDDPLVEERWCIEQRAAVSSYLHLQKLQHGTVGEWPAWHVAPYASIWAIESFARPGWIGWWVVSGDLPTDYVSSVDVKPSQHPRNAMRVFASNWLELAGAGQVVTNIGNFRIVGSNSPKDWTPLLESRARLFLRWADDDSLWEEQLPPNL